MPISRAEYEMMCRRHAPKLIPMSDEGVSREIEQLHEPILKWCREQIPQVPVIHARTDIASTIANGVPDFAILYRGKCLLIEAKSKTGKLSEAQQIWSFLAERQGFKVKLIRSMTEFYELIRKLQPPGCEEGVAHPTTPQQSAGADL